MKKVKKILMVVLLFVVTLNINYLGMMEKKVIVTSKEYKEGNTNNLVLNKILSNYNCIVEPKNYKINNLFCNQNNNLSNECKANKVYSIAYLEFLKKYVNDMELYNINEEWWNE